MQINSYNRQKSRSAFGCAKFCKPARGLVIDTLMPVVGDKRVVNQEARDILAINKAGDLPKKPSEKIKKIAERIVSALAPVSHMPTLLNPTKSEAEAVKIKINAEHEEKAKTALQRIQTGISEEGVGFVRKALEELDAHTSKPKAPKAKEIKKARARAEAIKKAEAEANAGVDFKKPTPEELKAEADAKSAALLEKITARSEARGKRKADFENEEAADPKNKYARQLAIGASIRRAFKKSGRARVKAIRESMEPDVGSAKKASLARGRRVVIRANMHYRQPEKQIHEATSPQLIAKEKTTMGK